jgi:hypothetical protein
MVLFFGFLAKNKKTVAGIIGQSCKQNPKPLPHTKK